MNQSAFNSSVRTSSLPLEGSADPAAAARLQRIHDLVRSGEYRVSAAAIADRMIEQMIFGPQRRQA